MVKKFKLFLCWLCRRHCLIVGIGDLKQKVTVECPFCGKVIFDYDGGSDEEGQEERIEESDK